ncbi:FGFR1 oncogene partner 2 homolog [Xylocopa sonorina]|uniref:FGFR1 oncogene partner 2 homolog n=1 Tax=Xylocopa sonorina TaxID=1818115 RepID=UPI00403AC058
MSANFQQIMLDIQKLTVRLLQNENVANHLMFEIKEVCGQITNMKEYQEEVEVIDNETKQKPQIQLNAGMQREIKHLQEMQAENKELKKTLEDYQHALELIMSKYRQQTASLLRLNKTDLALLHNTKYANIITNQAEKINEMAAVMKTAVALDEESEMKEKETYISLKEENTTLREIVNIANQYGSLNNEIKVESKSVQTDQVEP